MELYIIRHAQSANNALWSATGSSDGRNPDPDITEIGQRQAKLLAQALAQPRQERSEPERRWDPHNRYGYGLTHLYTSLMQRAIQTATIVSAAVDVPVQGWEAIHERGGIFRKDEASGERIGLPGPDRAFFERHYPNLELPETMGEGGWWARPSEKDDEVPARARRFVQELSARHGQSPDRVAIVTHGGFINDLLTVLLGLSGPVTTLAGEPKHVWWGVSNAGITRVDVSEEYVYLAYLDRVDHLPDELIT